MISVVIPIRSFIPEQYIEFSMSALTVQYKASTFGDVLYPREENSDATKPLHRVKITQRIFTQRVFMKIYQLSSNNLTKDRYS